MGRPLRLLVPNGRYHVFSRGSNRQQIFWDDRDYRRHLAILDTATQRYGIVVLAYCLMPNHVHVLARDPNASLSAAMQFLNGGYSRTTNRRHDRARHLFQNRFGAVRITTDTQLLVDFAYVALNPVAAGLCASAADYRWSGHRALAGLGPAAPFLAVAEAWAHFGTTPALGALAYAAFVDAEARRRASADAARYAFATGSSL